MRDVIARGKVPVTDSLISDVRDVVAEVRRAGLGTRGAIDTIGAACAIAPRYVEQLFYDGEQPRQIDVPRLLAFRRGAAALLRKLGEQHLLRAEQCFRKADELIRVDNRVSENEPNPRPDMAPARNGPLGPGDRANAVLPAD